MPTGQIGISIAGWGIAVDHVIADYVAGAAERLVLEGAERGDLLFVEGQGAILHPLYSGVTLGLLHGCTPHALVLVHEAGAERIDLEDRGGPPGPVIPPLAELSDLLLRLTTPLRPAPVVAIALSTRRDRERRRGARGDRAGRGRDRPRLRRPGALRRRAAVAGRRERARMTDPRLARYAAPDLRVLARDRATRTALLIRRRARARRLAVAVGARGLAPRCARERRDGAPRGRASDLLRYGSDEQVAYLDPADARGGRALRPLAVRLGARQHRRARRHRERPRRRAWRVRAAAGCERHDEREAAGELRWLGAGYPTALGAQTARMGTAAWERFVYAALLLDEPDPVAAWRALGERHARLIERLAGARELRVMSAGTDLRVNVDGRAWESCAGEANLPDGEVFCCPPRAASRARSRSTCPRCTTAGRAATCACASRPASSSTRRPRSARTC